MVPPPGETGDPAYDAPSPPHQRNKSSVFRSFIGGSSNNNNSGGGGHHHHKRNNSDGTTLPSAFALPPPPPPSGIATNPGFYASEQNLAINRNGVYHVGWEPPSPSIPHSATAMSPPPNPISSSRYPPITRHGYALEELQQNRQDTRSPERQQQQQPYLPPPPPRGRFDPQYTSNGPPSPTKLGPFPTISLRALGNNKDSSKPPKKEYSPVKPKKAKSATNLGGLLLRPKSYKNLKNQFLGDDNDGSNDKREKDKENRSPGNSLDADRQGQGQGGPNSHPPPIYAQFASGLSTSPPVELPIRNSSSGTHSVIPGGNSNNSNNSGRSGGGDGVSRPPITQRPGVLGVRPRPKSFTSYVTGSSLRDKSRDRSGDQEENNNKDSNSSSGSKISFKRLTWGRGDKSAKEASAAGVGGTTTTTTTTTENVSRPLISNQNVVGSGSSNRSKSTTRLPNNNGSSGGGAGGRNRSGRAGSNTADLPAIEPQDIDKHLEAMLDRRNIPENQRYKMRNLSDTVKMEFIRQDWAEMVVAKKNEEAEGRGSMDVSRGRPTERDLEEAAGEKPTTGKKKKHGRGLSLTLGRVGGGGSKEKDGEKSPSKKKGDSSLGRHFRGKSSSESLVNGGGGGESGGEQQQESTTISSSGGGFGAGFMAKVKGQQLPGDFVSYLRKVQKPELVEVGKLHKLRLLLRNETVSWIEDFIRQSGMEEIVSLLNRIMGLEWREEHEDALLHEVLLCLKALCTTSLALVYLHAIHSTLFPSLLHLIFDPEKKGPSEFTTRSIITSILFTYIQASPTPADKIARSQTVLSFLRDPDPLTESKTLDFVVGMQKPRPYRVWNKEVVNVTKEVFWIFLHNLNIVSLPPPANENTPVMVPGHEGFVERHFPQERPPVPAAPYVGGVEWDATNYLASHLDLLNAIVACTGPGREERNRLREELRVSGWERVMGGTMRMCKEKFYGGVHDGLRTWVRAAVEDGWDVRDVRFGPAPGESKSRSVSPKKKEQVEKVPRLEMPRFDFAPLPVLGTPGGDNGVGLGINTAVAQAAGGGGSGGQGGLTPRVGTPRGGVVKADDFWLS
ncbi:armadillo-type protein [Triangularia verruculosa]|uniref:Armadillo-type protein n=1 Tax=Triangularia verruculosa TaxID=2587418 RepID=A0AAN7ATI7_9PEZI|nr:armadillo-type protein [Triangularia verruculosa]